MFDILETTQIINAEKAYTPRGNAGGWQQSIPTQFLFRCQCTLNTALSFP